MKLNDSMLGKIFATFAVLALVIPVVVIFISVKYDDVIDALPTLGQYKLKSSPEGRNDPENGFPDAVTTVAIFS